MRLRISLCRLRHHMFTSLRLRHHTSTKLHICHSAKCPCGTSPMIVEHLLQNWMTNHQQVVGNPGRPVLHHPILGNMWTEGLSSADQPQKKKSLNNQAVSSLSELIQLYGPSSQMLSSVDSYLVCLLSTHIHSADWVFFLCQSTCSMEQVVLCMSWLLCSN